MNKSYINFLAVVFLSMTFASTASDQPNVILVMTDDQGYGDLGCNGNAAIKTPHLDRLSTQGIQLDNFHVDPTCAPTRAALMTGRYSARCGVWHTVQGRNMLRTREITMADVFMQNNYRTGIFGKWHLGDNYPYRPEDRGFQYCVYHKAGGIGQAPDYWGNDYFDDHYMKNGTLHFLEGFCTDVWFEESIKFIKESVQNDTPFFAYITPNAPHSPFYCPEEYTSPYEDNPNVSRPEFYGMVSNIDENIGRLMSLLDELSIADNTILIFTTDNGTAGGIYEGRGFRAGMRGSKNSAYEGGHRVPCFMRWPDGKFEQGKKISELTAHLDLLPTLIDLCSLKAPDISFDGQNIKDLLYSSDEKWLNRTLIVESQRVKHPVKWRKCAVMTDRWRLIDGKELYDLKVDPAQEEDIAINYPDIVKKLRNEYSDFWKEVSKEHGITSHIVIGNEQAPLVSLSSHDWLVDALPPWNQIHIVKGEKANVSYWALEVEQAGDYEISLRRWPVEADKPINNGTYGKAFSYHSAKLRIGDIEMISVIPPGAKEVTFKVTLPNGLLKLSPVFISDEIESTPYYAYITHQPKAGWQTPKGMNIPIYDPSRGRLPPQLEKPAL
ncbi:MAG: N-acetylgalactosamine-4-sulfatase [Kiritimatiellaceae bacterium]|nr:N-acetylgalactosamine-4-sulfatase [Kiritimatiellaceae bacterium]